MASSAQQQTYASFVATQPPTMTPEADIQDPRHQKSLRRKYQKIRHQFKGSIAKSNDLLHEEQRSIALARRLQEQLDGLLELLLDVNEEQRMPPQHKYDLRSPSPSASIVPSLETDQDTDASTRAERRTRPGPKPDHDVEPGQVKSLGLLEETTSHTPFPAEHLPDDLIGEDLPGYMTPNREEEYLLALDAVVEQTPYHFQDRSGRPLQLGDRGKPSEKEIVARNPDSAYNWLRKNKPEVFLQDAKPDQENASEKSSARPSGTGRKRGKNVEATPKEPKTEQELLDEEIGFVPEVTASGRRKNHKNDDDAYRPKGGTSRTKRKREDGEKAPRKKARNSGANA